LDFSVFSPGVADLLSRMRPPPPHGGPCCRSNGLPSCWGRERLFSCVLNFLPTSLPGIFPAAPLFFLASRLVLLELMGPLGHFSLFSPFLREFFSSVRRLSCSSPVFSRRACSFYFFLISLLSAFFLRGTMAEILETRSFKDFDCSAFVLQRPVLRFLRPLKPRSFVSLSFTTRFDLFLVFSSCWSF